MNDEQKIDNMEIVLSSFTLREVAEILVYQEDAMKGIRKIQRRYINAYADLYKKTNGGKAEVKDE